MVQPKYWLASNSPRRREMLAWLEWNMEASAANIDESRHPKESVRDFVLRLAEEKSTALIPGAVQHDVVIAADTIVVLDEEILGKPSDARQAHEMLTRLRGRDHLVITGLAVRIFDSDAIHLDICTSCVHMRDYSDDEIKAYIGSGDPLDKAGGYAIQNPGFHPAVEFNGCFASVMGMPLCHLERTLMKFPFYQYQDIAAICQNNLKYRCSIANRVMSGEDVG